MLGIVDYFWRLLPGNPILRRVVETGGKRRRDLFIRCGYLGLLIGVVVFSLLSGTGNFAGMSLDDLAKVSAQLFRTTSYWQLGLVAFLAPVFTAGAITQEKDSQTYDILLATPLTNAQIVLGSLLSRLFFVITLLISGIPIFSITQIFGGVAIASIAYSFAIAAATAFVTGAIAMAIAVFKVGTRRTIFSFYLFITVYVAGLWMLDTMPYFHPLLNNGERSTTSWFTGIHPFLALRVIFNQKEHLPPDLLSLPDNLRRWPLGWYFSNPTSFYISFMFFLSFVLVSPSIVLLRKLAQSTNSVRSWVLQKLRISKGDKTRKPRNVWSNPIAWREAKTKASAARASVLRYTFMAAGLGGAAVLAFMYASTESPATYVDLPSSFDPTNRSLVIFGKNDPPLILASERVNLLTESDEGSATVAQGITALPRGRYTIAGGPTYQKDPYGRTVALDLTLAHVKRTVSISRARAFLLGMIGIEFAVILLIVTNAAASTVTREKEDGSLDLLLATPITSRYYIWGKLRGLVSFVIPLASIPLASILLFVLYDLIRMAGGGQDVEWVVFPEALLVLPGTLTIVVAFAAILGMQMSLRCRRTVMAVMSSVGIVMGVCVGLGLCGYKAVDKGPMGSIGLVFGSFSPFTLMTLLIDPRAAAKEQFGFDGPAGADGTSSVGTARMLVFVFGWIATGAYTLVVWGMYKSMVKNFDMTIRKQSR
jgi:ABC-type transport system involved in multi-copper enzyme maturation permease subunit